MLRKIDKIKDILLAISSGALLSLSFPGFNLGFFAYLAFIPLFFSLKNCTKKRAFALSYLCGFVFFGITIFWLRHVSFPGYILLILTLSIFFGLFGFFIRLTAYNRQFNIFLLPVFWVVLEYVRSNFFTGFGWALLGHSQYLTLPAIQIADITGVYGVSFMIIIVNLALYNLLFKRDKTALFSVVAAIFVTGAIFGYGFLKLNDNKTPDKHLTVSLIQGNIPQDAKWDPSHKDIILDTYSHLTREAGKKGGDLIIWPETALPGFIEEKELSNVVEELAKEVDLPLLIGAPTYNRLTRVIYNSAFLISREGMLLERHDKLHLVPFGEYIPFAEYFDFLREYIDKPIGNFAKGDKYTVFQLENGAKFGVLICFEDIFSELAREFALKDADFIINITNDAWFMKTAAPYQHAQSSVFRAVENKIAVVRAANTGLSCFIDKYGKITDSVNINNEEIFVAGHKTKKIEISKNRSFYSRFGDIFVFVLTMLLLIYGVRAWRKRYL